MGKLKTLKEIFDIEDVETINLEDVNKIITLAYENDIEVLCIEGCLLDNYLIYNNNTIRFNKETAKYIIIKEKYLNSNSSTSTITLTDDDNLALQFEKDFEQFYEDEEY